MKFLAFLFLFASGQTSFAMLPCEFEFWSAQIRRLPKNRPAPEVNLIGPSHSNRPGENIVIDLQIEPQSLQSQYLQTVTIHFQRILSAKRSLYLLTKEYVIAQLRANLLPLVENSGQSIYIQGPPILQSFVREWQYKHPEDFVGKELEFMQAPVTSLEANMSLASALSKDLSPFENRLLHLISYMRWDQRPPR